jgi:hypothetical protein
MQGDTTLCSYASAANPNSTLGADRGSKSQHTEDQLHCLEHLVAEAIKLHQGKTQSPVRSINPSITMHQ